MKHILKTFTNFRNLVQFSPLTNILELFLRCTILVLVFNWKLWCGLTRWLACEWYLDLLSTRLVGVLRWGKIASSGRVDRVVFSRQQLWCSSVAALFGHLLPQQGGVIQFWMLPSVLEIGLGSTSCPALGGYFPVLAFMPLSFFFLRKIVKFL
jgi:hypothetical protein